MMRGWCNKGRLKALRHSFDERDFKEKIKQHLHSVCDGWEMQANWVTWYFNLYPKVKE